MKLEHTAMSANISTRKIILNNSKKQVEKKRNEKKT